MTLKTSCKESPLPPIEEARTLKARLAPLQEPKGYFFNSDEALVLELLQQLILTKQRHGYMACPCRLANGTLANDKDIVCPCEYREADVKEFGACFCRLYVNKAWNDNTIPHAVVPERRPPEKIIF